MNIDEEKLALEVAKGITGFFERIVAPDVKAIITVLNSHTELLKEHSQKLDKLNESISKLEYVPELLKEHGQKLGELSDAVSELKHVPKLLDEHGQKLDKLTDSIHQIDLKQSEILAKLDLEQRVRTLERDVAEIKGKG